MPEHKVKKKTIKIEHLIHFTGRPVSFATKGDFDQFHGAIIHANCYVAYS